jgi:outer membrane murein-binding lipoprotein Lpp
MKQDFSELVGYLDKKFGEVNGKVDGLTTTVNTLQKSVDGIAKDNKTKEEETKVLNYRMKQAEDVLDKVAPKLGLKYEH